MYIYIHIYTGIANVCTDLNSNIGVYTVEPCGFDKMKRSLELGGRVENVKIIGSICDSLLSPMAGIYRYLHIHIYAFMDRYIQICL
jgi:threonine dehydratase